MPGRYSVRTVAGREVHDIIIDAGSGASIVASDLLPRNPVFTGYIWLAGFDAEPKRYRLVSLPVIMDGMSLTAPMAVVPRETLRGNSALLGRNIPGLAVKQVLCPTSVDANQQQPPASPQDSHPVLAVQTRAQKAKEDQKRAQEDKDSEDSGIPVTNLSLDDTADTGIQQEQLREESPANLDDAMEHDNRSSPETLVEEDVTDPLPLEYPHPKPALPKMPLGAEAFSKEQKQDGNLATLWEQAKTTLASTILWMGSFTSLLKMNWSKQGTS